MNGNTPLRVSKQPLVPPGLGAAHGVTCAAAPEGTTGGGQLFGVALWCVKERRGGNAQMLRWPWDRETKPVSAAWGGCCGEVRAEQVCGCFQPQNLLLPRQAPPSSSFSISWSKSSHVLPLPAAAPQPDAACAGISFPLLSDVLQRAALQAEGTSPGSCCPFTNPRCMSQPLKPLAQLGRQGPPTKRALANWKPLLRAKQSTGQPIFLQKTHLILHQRPTQNRGLLQHASKATVRAIPE